MKVVMFSGQGSQYRGMGKKLFEKYRQQTARASEILGYDLEELCLRDPEKKLGQTQYTQPALYVVNALHYLDQEEQGTERPDYFMGHSLGEYNALLAAGAFDFETGLRLVQKRGELMAAASGGGMIAVIGVEEKELRAALDADGLQSLDIANYNTPSQIVVSGRHEDIAVAKEKLTARGFRAVLLSVSAPFHSRYMSSAATEFAEFLKSYNFSSLKTPVVSNVTARPYSNDLISSYLSRQIESSVQWIDSVRYLMGRECDEYSEMGSSILTKMVNEIKSKTTPLTPESTAKASSAGTDLAGSLGSALFRKDYNLKYAYVAGGMYRGASSPQLVTAMGKAGLLGFLGTGGLALDKIEEYIRAIRQELGQDGVFGMNLLNNIYDPEMEMNTVKLFLRYGIKVVEAAAYIKISLPLVYFRVSGLEQDPAGNIICRHKVLAKFSRPEVAEGFMKPAPPEMVNELLLRGMITAEQASMAASVPMSYDVCVEADSGGHTDRGVAMVLFPAVCQLRDQLQKTYGYKRRINTGLAGGIGTPLSAACAFAMGADFILTGSINQCTVEAGASHAVKDMLQQANVQDTDYAPAGDMFEIGAKVQVLKKGVLFPGRANKLYNLYMQYNSLEEIPEDTRIQLEKKYFMKPLETVWQETRQYFSQRGLPQEIKRAEENPKYRMALVFRWYFGLSTRVAFAGDLSQKVNFQVHTGPAMGAFNQWVKGTELENWRNRHVAQIGTRLMEETAALMKKQATALQEII